MVRTSQEGDRKSSEMTDIFEFLLSNFATLVLAAVTAVLVYVTYRLKMATDHLARSQILPRLTLKSEPNYFPRTSQQLMIPIVNRGIGSAFNTHVFTIKPNIGRPEVELLVGSRDISPLSDNPLTQEPTIFVIRGILEEIELTIELQYEDGEGYEYSKVIPTRTPAKATTQGETP